MPAPCIGIPSARPARGGESNRPESHAGLLPQLSTALGAASASGLVRRRASPSVPDQSPWSWTGPLVRDRSAATAGADRRNPGRPGDPRRLNAVRQPGGAERGTFRAHRNPVDGPGPAGPGRWRGNGVAGRPAAAGCVRQGPAEPVHRDKARPEGPAQGHRDAAGPGPGAARRRAQRHRDRRRADRRRPAGLVADHLADPGRRGDRPASRAAWRP